MQASLQSMLDAVLCARCGCWLHPESLPAWGMDRQRSACWAPFLENTRLGEPSTQQHRSKTGRHSQPTRVLWVLHKEAPSCLQGGNSFWKVHLCGRREHSQGSMAVEKKSSGMGTEREMGHAYSPDSRECCQVPRKCPGISREWPDLRHLSKGPPVGNQNHMGCFLVNVQTYVS